MLCIEFNGLEPMHAEHEAIDPVCGMTIPCARAPYTRDHGGATWYLCSAECRVKFDADGEAYIATARLQLPGWGETPHPDSVIEQFRPEA